MAIEILVEESPLKYALEQAVELFHSQLDAEGFVVFLEEAPKRSRYSGFDKVLAKVGTGLPIIMLAISPARMLAADPRYHLAMSYGQVHYVDAFNTVVGILEIFTNPNRKRRPDNLLVRDVYSLPRMRVDEMASIRHDLGHAERAEAGSEARQRMDASWLPLAKGIFGELSREKLITKIEESKNPGEDYAPLAGRSYDCFCVDVEGTLLNPDGSIDEQVRQRLDEEAKTKPVAIWTGGNVEAIGKRLRQEGILYPVIAKQLLRGVTIAEALDDEFASELDKLYGVFVEKITHPLKVE